MDSESLFKGFTILAAFIGLLLSGAKHRRDSRQEERKQVLEDLEVLRTLREDSFHYDRVEARLNKAIQKTYPPHENYNLAAGLIGLVVYVGFGLWGTFLMLEHSWWATGAFMLACVGFEAQRRSFIPGFKEKYPKVSLSREGIL